MALLVMLAFGQSSLMPRKQQLYPGTSTESKQNRTDVQSNFGTEATFVGFAQNGRIHLNAELNGMRPCMYRKTASGSESTLQQMLQVRPVQSDRVCNMQRGVVKTAAVRPLENNDERPMIIETPEGEQRLYRRSGKAYKVDPTTGASSIAEQEGLLDVVFNKETRKVYFKDLISTTEIFDTWVEADLSADGKTISLPMGQNVYYMPLQNSMIQLFVLKYDPTSGGYRADENIATMEFDVVGDEICMKNSNENIFLGTVYSDDGSWTGLGDFNTILTNFPDREVIPPSDLQEVQKFFIHALNHENRPIKGLAYLGFVGNDVYLGGLCFTYNKNAWIKGTREGNTLRFPSGQYLGEYNQTNIMFMSSVSSDGTHYEDLVFTLNEETGAYVTENWVIENGEKDQLKPYEIYKEITLEKCVEVPIITDIISDQPEGEFKVYSRSGTSTSLTFWGKLEITPQQGTTINIVYAEDGSVYMQSPIAKASTRGSWVKGTRDGNKLKFPLYQTVIYYPEEGYGAMTAKLRLVSYTNPQGQTYNEYEAVLDDREVTFTVNDADGTIKLDGTLKGEYAYGLIFTDDYTWSGYCDFETKYKLFTDEIAEFPESVEAEEWAYQYTDEKGEYKGRLVNVAIDGDAMYIAGLLEDAYFTVIKGTIDGDKVTFKGDQYLGRNLKEEIIYFGAARYVDQGNGKYIYYYIPQIEFDFDRQAHKLSMSDETALILNKGITADLVYPYSADFKPSFTAYNEAPSIPEDPTILDFQNEYFDFDKFSTLTTKIYPRDVNGNYIMSERLYYQILTKKAGEVKPYIFSTDKHQYITETMEMVPYLFTDDYDIKPNGSKIYILENDFDDIGIQVINMSGDSECRSNRVWFKAGVEKGTQSAINEVEQQQNLEVKSIVYYNLSGIRLNEPQRGVNILRVTYTDGTQKTFKRICK